MRAPIRNRNPGFSRRAQYGLFLAYVAAGLGVLAGLAMILAAHLDPARLSALRAATLDFTAPVSALGREGVRGAEALAAGAGAYLDAGRQNRELRAELAGDRAALVRARILALENMRLRRLVRLVEQHTDPVAVARMIGSTGTSPRRLATLAAGSDAGVRAGQPVRAPEGLVGRVLEAGRWASRVLLVTDNASVVPVRLARGGAPALAAGRGDGSIELRPLGAGANPFRRGDIVLTSGTGGLYPPDVPVAVVLRRQGDVAVAWPLADPARLDYAIVEPPYVGLPEPPAPPRAAAP